MNIIALTGNICRDLEIKYTKNNKGYLENSIGVRKDKKDEKGKYQSDFIDFVCFEKKADFLKEYAKKGDKIEIVGKLRVDNWKDDEGKSHTRSYVVCDKVNILTARNTNQKVEKDDETKSFDFDGNNPYEIDQEDLPF